MTLNTMKYPSESTYCSVFVRPATALVASEHASQAQGSISACPNSQARKDKDRRSIDSMYTGGMSRMLVQFANMQGGEQLQSLVQALIIESAPFKETLQILPALMSYGNPLPSL